MWHPQKITFDEMRAAGFHGVLVNCASAHTCNYWRRLSADFWPDEARLSDLEPRGRGAKAKPD